MTSCDDVIFVVSVSQVLSRFQLTHEEIVERRKLMSEKGSPDGHKPVSTTARTGQGAAQYWVPCSTGAPYSAVCRTVQGPANTPHHSALLRGHLCLTDRKYDDVFPLLRSKFPMQNVTVNWRYHCPSQQTVEPLL